MLRLITLLRLIIWPRYQVTTNYWHFLEVIVVDWLLGLLLRIHDICVVYWIDDISRIEDKLILVTGVISNIDSLDMANRAKTDLGMQLLILTLETV